MTEPRTIDLSQPDVLVVIPTFTEREDLLKRAVASIREDMGKVLVAGAIEVDIAGLGPAACRNRAVIQSMNAGMNPTWIAFLDDDDEFHPGHLEKLVAHANETGADVVYPWFDLMVNGRLDNERDILRLNGDYVIGQPFDPASLDDHNYIPVTALIRTTSFLAAGGFPEPNSEVWPHPDCEDWGLWLRLRDTGAVFSHLPERTWIWNWHGRNTSGRPDRVERYYGDNPAEPFNYYPNQ